MLRLDINLVFNIINVLLIFAIIRIFLFKPVKKVLAKRKEEIDQQYKDAQAAEDAANELKNQYQEQLGTIETERQAAINEARSNGNLEYERIVAEANKEADRVIERAKMTAMQEKEQAIKEAKEEIADMVLTAATKVVASGQGKDADKQIYDEFLAKTGEQ